MLVRLSVCADAVQLSAASGLCYFVLWEVFLIIHQARSGNNVQESRAGQALHNSFNISLLCKCFFKTRFSHLFSSLPFLLPCSVHCLPSWPALHTGTDEITPEQLHQSGSALFISKLNFILGIICKKMTLPSSHR